MKTPVGTGRETLVKYPLLGPGYLRSISVALEGLVQEYDLEYNTTRMYCVALNRLAYWLEATGKMLTYDAVQQYNEYLGSTCSSRSARSKRLQIRAALRLLQQLNRLPYDFSDCLAPLSEVAPLEVPKNFEEIMGRLSASFEGQVYAKICHYVMENRDDLNIVRACAYIELGYIYLLPGMLIESLHTVSVGMRDLHVLPCTSRLTSMQDCPCLWRYMEMRDAKSKEFFGGDVSLLYKVQELLVQFSQRSSYTFHQFIRRRTKQVIASGLPVDYLSKAVYLSTTSLYRLAQREMGIDDN